MSKASGFSIIELVIAVSLASFVLIGVASIAANMARRQVEGIRSGTVTGWSLVSYATMAKEIEDSNVLAYPAADGAATDAVTVCKNWSRLQTGGKMDATANVEVIHYCLDTGPMILRRYANIGFGVVCPTPGSAVANCPASPGGWAQTGAVGFKVERLSGQTVFLRRDSIGGVQLRYVIGQQGGTANDPNPRFTQFNFGVSMQKQYNNTSD